LEDILRLCQNQAVDAAIRPIELPVLAGDYRIMTHFVPTCGDFKASLSTPEKSRTSLARGICKKTPKRHAGRDPDKEAVLSF